MIGADSTGEQKTPDECHFHFQSRFRSRPLFRAGTKETNLTEGKVMFDIAILDEPTELPLQAVEKVTPIAAAEPKKVRPTL